MLAYAPDFDKKCNEIVSTLDKITDLIWKQKQMLIRVGNVSDFRGELNGNNE